MGLNEIKLALLEKIMDAKMLEYGFTETRPIHLNQQLFAKKNGSQLSANALKVFEKGTREGTSTERLLKLQMRCFGE
jgi:hypothetical protein